MIQGISWTTATNSRTVFSMVFSFLFSWVEKNGLLLKFFFRALCWRGATRVSWLVLPSQGSFSWLDETLCSTIPWPCSGWPLQFVFFLLRREASSPQAGVKAASLRARPSLRGSLALTQERRADYIAGPPRRKNSRGQV